MGVVDDSFKKPGAIPFKWEIKPGVPKLHSQQQTQPRRTDLNRHRSSPPEKLRPPPSGPIFPPSQADCSRAGGSFRSAPRSRSERWRFDQPAATMKSVPAGGCFFSPLLRRKPSSKNRGSSGRIRSSNRDGEEDDSAPGLDLETLSRWSVSSRKSFASPFRGSPSSSSCFSSPRTLNDAEWAGFGLF